MKYAIISDIHCAYHMLRDCLQSIREKDISKIICLGDIVGYGNYPEQTVAEIIKNNIICVAGNHERAIFENHAYHFMNENAKSAIDKNISDLSEESMSFLEKLPLNYIEDSVFFVHGMPPKSPFKYLTHYDNHDIKDLKLEDYEQRFFFCGHTHRTEIVEVSIQNKIRRFKEIDYNHTYNLNHENKYLINVGSISRSRMSHKKTNYVIFDSSENTLEFIII